MRGFQAKTIVAPVDFSEESIAALGTALDIADNPSDVHVVHVTPPLEVIEWVDESGRRQRAVEEVRDQLSDEKFTQVDMDIEIGDPGRGVADFAERIGADLIVIPSHGRTGLAHMLQGSVAERVVRLSHCPVLVLRN
jgi:nucleotide-binding universal stress UspA family protein